MDDVTPAELEARRRTLYERLHAALADTLGGAVVAIDKIPHRRDADAAADVVELAVAIECFDDCGDALVPAVESLGFTYVPEGERDVPYRRYFERLRVGGDGGRTAYRLHVYEHANRARLLAEI